MTSRQISRQFVLAVGVTLAAIFLLDVMGAIVKHLGGQYPPQQLAMFRNVFGIVPSLLVLVFTPDWHKSGRKIVIAQWKLGLARGGFLAIAQFCFYRSLTNMEFAVATTIVFSGPLFLTALSIPILSHKVGVWRWAAVMAGFAGVVMVMQPDGDAFNGYALLALAAAFFYSLGGVTARLFGESVPTAMLNLYSAAGAVTGSVAFVVFTDGFIPVASIQDWLWIFALGLAGGVAVLGMIWAYRIVEPSVLSPFQYFGIPFSFCLGWLFFDEAPFGQLVPGVFLIVGGGLLIIWREQIRDRSQSNIPRE